jgi:uncharacterized protein (TIGR00251 family)
MLYKKKAEFIRISGVIITAKGGGRRVEFYSKKNNRISLAIKVQTGMQRTKIAGVRNGELVIHINARPENNEANDELVRFLSKTLGITRAEVEIKTGHHSRHKVVVVPGSTKGRVEAVARDLVQNHHQSP